jgi:hypothetical protein
MWSSADNEQLSFRALFTEAQEMKQFYHEPASDAGIHKAWQ